MRRDNGEIVLIDLSHASDNDMGQETVSIQVADLLNPNDKSKYDAYKMAENLQYMVGLFPSNENRKGYTYFLRIFR